LAKTSKEKFDILFTKLKSSTSMILCVAYVDQALAGFAIFSYNKTRRSCVLEWICIDPTMQRQGIGKKLVFSVQDFISEITSIAVVTNKKNTISPHFYRSLGFIKTGFTLPEYDAALYQGYELTIEH